MAPTIDRLKAVVERDAAMRRVQHLQPVGGPGNNLFPPTYPGDDEPVHIFETRRIAGQEVRCVLNESVQSQV